MKIKLLLLATLFFLLHHISFAQTPGYFYSSIRRPVQNKQDSLLLLRNEQKMWTAAGKGNIPAFDNPMFDCEFKVKMSMMAIQGSLRDSVAFKNGAPHYLMNLMENRNADTCYLMSFSPYLFYQYHERMRWVQDSVQPTKPDTITTGNRLVFSAGHWEMGPWQTGSGVRLLMPLNTYPAVIPAKELKNTDVIYRNQLAAQLGGKLSGDTIYRIARFTCDSNEYLPQAPYANLIIYLQNCLFAGKLRAYSNKNLNEALSKYRIELACVRWDSTNQVEDPNNPGTFIIAPLKTEGRPKSFLVAERWVSFTPGNSTYYPKPYMGYMREVAAYGLLLTSGSVLWLSSTDADIILTLDHYNMQPYEECFRAERFKTLQVQVHTW